jgi:hypothetical protein
MKDVHIDTQSVREPTPINSLETEREPFSNYELSFEGNHIEQIREFIERTRERPNVDESIQLAAKFIEKYKTIGTAKVIHTYYPTSIIFYDESTGVIAGEEDWENRVTAKDLKAKTVAAKTQVSGDISEKELPRDTSDESIIELVYEFLLKEDEKDPMDVYCIYSIQKTPVFRHFVRTQNDEVLVSTEEELDRWLQFDLDETTHEEISNPYWRLMIRYSGNKLPSLNSGTEEQ